MILCGVDGQVCEHQQYCPSKRAYEITISAKKCAKKESHAREDESRKE